MLHCDGYCAYGRLEEVILVCCLAHCRRKFYEAVPKERRKKLKLLDIHSEQEMPEPKEGTASDDTLLPAEKWVAFCNRLFYLERLYKDFPAGEREQKRQEKESGIWEVQSLNFPGKRAQFHVSSVPEVKQNSWADHLRGGALILGQSYKLRYGIAGVLERSLPIDGLASSAAVIIVFLFALCKVNDFRLGEWEMIMTATAAENRYVGVNCGKLDQSCEVLCRKDQLLYLDTRDDSYELISTAPNMPDYKIAIFFSGLERSLVDSKYNARQDECKATAYALKAFAGTDYERFVDTQLWDVPAEVYRQYGDRLPENWKKRAEHYYTEYACAKAGSEAWRRGELQEYDRLVFESGHSSVHNYESGCPELIKLYEIMCHTYGIYGGQFSGAGFKGCCMALIDPKFARSTQRRVKEEYLKEFPALKGRYQFALCESADGAVM